MSLGYALVRSSLTAVRAKPIVRAEQISQEVLGAVLQVLERDTDWARVRGEDGYEGWVTVGGLHHCDAAAADAWRSGSHGAPAIVLDAVVEDSSGAVLKRLPWGSRLLLDGPGALLPDGRTGKLLDGEWTLEDELRDRFPPSGKALAKTAARWLGAPYSWGGRTLWGVDCSGYAQACYRLHGMTLPRDSYQQERCGAPIEPGRDFARLKEGDLVYFRGEESEHVMHVAISLGGSRIVHSSLTNGGVAIDDLSGDSGFERALAMRAISARRLFGLSA